MKPAATVDAQRALLAAAFALVSERCRKAYMHDLKGCLQSLHSAVELLSRSLGTPPGNPAMLEKAAALAKRALATHETELLAFSLQTAPSEESKSSVDLGELVTQTMRFLGNDVLALALSSATHLAGDVSVLAEAHQCRMLVLGLSVTSMDVLPRGAAFIASVYRDGAAGCMELSTPATAVPTRLSIDWPAQATASLTAHDFLLGVTAGWAAERGGSVVIKEGVAERSVLLRLPVANVT